MSSFMWTFADACKTDQLCQLLVAYVSNAATAASTTLQSRLKATASFPVTVESKPVAGPDGIATGDVAWDVLVYNGDVPASGGEVTITMDSSCGPDCRHCRCEPGDPHFLSHEIRRVPSAKKSSHRRHRFELILPEHLPAKVRAVTETAPAVGPQDAQLLAGIERQAIFQGAASFSLPTPPSPAPWTRPSPRRMS